MDIINTSVESDPKRIECSQKGCNKKPTHGLLYGKALHCKKHKANEYINVVKKRWLRK